MKKNNAVRTSKWQKKYLEKAKIVLNSNDDTIINAIESTIDVFFESVINESNRINNYYMRR